MASRTLEITFVGNAKPVSDAFAKVEQDGGRLGNALGGLKNAFGGVATVATGLVVGGALMKAPGFLMDAAKAAAEDEAATLRLNKSLENYMGTLLEGEGVGRGTIEWQSEMSQGMKELTGDMNERIAAGQKLAFTDDEVRDSMQFLLAATGDYGEATKRSAAAMDLARGANIPLTQATKMLGKLNEENVEVFKKLGITLGDNATEAEALAAVQAKFGGQAKEYANSTAGQFQQAKIAMAEIVESIGGAVLPAFTSLATLAAEALPKVQEMVGGIAEKAAALVEVGWDKVSGPLSTIAGLAWDGAVAGFNALKEVAAVTWDGAVAGFNAIKDFASGEVAPRLSAMAGSLREIAQQKFDQIAPAFQNLGSAIKGVEMRDINAGFQTLKEKLEPAIEFLKPLAERVLVALKDAFNDVGEALKPMGPALQDLGEALEPLTPLLEPLAKVLGTALVLAIGAFLLALEGIIRVMTTTLVVAIDGMVLAVKGITLAIEGVTKVVEEWAPKIGGAFLTVWTTFKANIELIVGLFTPLLNIGAGIVSGIVDGIWAGAEKIKNAASSMIGWIEDQIPDWIPHSPSKRGVEIGQGFVDGIVAGIQDTAPELAAEIQRMFDAIDKTNEDALQKFAIQAQQMAAMVGGVMAGGTNTGIGAVGGFMGQAILGSDGNWYRSEAEMPPGVTGASGGISSAYNDPNARSTGTNSGGGTWIAGKFYADTDAGPGAQHRGIVQVHVENLYARDHTEQGLATGDLNFLAGLQTAGAR